MEINYYFHLPIAIIDQYSVTDLFEPETEYHPGVFDAVPLLLITAHILLFSTENITEGAEVKEKG